MKKNGGRSVYHFFENVVYACILLYNVTNLCELLDRKGGVQHSPLKKKKRYGFCSVPFDTDIYQTFV